MVLSGNLNKEIIAHLQTFGGKAVGLSGKDGNLIQADKKKHASGIDLGYVGTIRQINPELAPTDAESSSFQLSRQ